MVANKRNVCQSASQKEKLNCHISELAGKLTRILHKWICLKCFFLKKNDERKIIKYFVPVSKNNQEKLFFFKKKIHATQ